VGVKKIIIAIDGHSSCGKSTLAKEIANNLSYIYVDTGAMYRAVSYYFMKNGLIKNGLLEISKVADHLNKIHIQFKKQSDHNLHTFLNNQDIEKEIRSMEVSNLVSEVSKHALVRQNMVALQQKMGEQRGIILDGRDIGTVVFPNAEVKLFLTADAKIRAQRRYDELIEKGESVNFEEVLKNINDRDFQDENRKESPLKKAKDAIVIDNSFLNKKEQLEKSLEIIRTAL